MHVEPTREQLEAFAGAELSGPVVMLNLLRFRERAEGLEEDLSGQEAYARYGAGVAPLLAGVGGEVVWAGRAHAGVIGPRDERWDQVLLVRYPSRDAFLAMVSSEEYAAVAPYRTAALSDSRLVAMTAIDLGG